MAVTKGLQQNPCRQRKARSERTSRAVAGASKSARRRQIGRHPQSRVLAPVSTCLAQRVQRTTIRSGCVTAATGLGFTSFNVCVTITATLPRAACGRRRGKACADGARTTLRRLSG